MAWASPLVVAVFRWVNELGSRWVLAPGALVLVVAVPAARRRWWLWMGALVLAPILEDLTKLVVRRPRPEGLAFGFPSGHVTAAAVFFPLAAHLLGEALETRGARAILAVLATAAVLAVALARILLRAHWPADVLGGAALGFACAALATWWRAR